jgi:SAM-dependent methyltransferase
MLLHAPAPPSLRAPCVVAPRRRCCAARREARRPYAAAQPPPPPPPPPPSSGSSNDAASAAAAPSRRALITRRAAFACACCTGVYAGAAALVRTWAAALSAAQALTQRLPFCHASLSRTQVSSTGGLTRYDWYRSAEARAMATSMGGYEAAIAARKAALFARVFGGGGGANGAGAADGNAAQQLDVVEVGVGAGPNLRFYPSGGGVRSVTGVEPNEFMVRTSMTLLHRSRRPAPSLPADVRVCCVCARPARCSVSRQAPYAQAAAAAAGVPLSLRRGYAEALPLPDACADVVVTTLVLCTVRDPAAALAEVARVLRPGGAYLFIEHVAADASHAPVLAAAQRLLDPAQQLLAGGCHLTRATGALIRDRCAAASSSGGGGGDDGASIASSSSFPKLFASLSMDAFDAADAWPITPHVAGVARKAGAA